MKIKDLSKNGTISDSRIDVEGTTPTNGISNVTQADNSPVLMNLASGPAQRGSRADALIETMGMDNYRLGNEAPRKQKMKG